MNGLKKAAVAIVVSGLGLAGQSLSAAEETKTECESAKTAGVSAYPARIPVKQGLRRVAHEARVSAMRASSDQFFDRARAQSGQYPVGPIEPWSQNFEAQAELQHRMLDPWGSAMIDHLKADSERRLAAYGQEAPPVDSRHEAVREWARQQQAAIYDNARRLNEAWWKAMPKVSAQPVPVAPYAWPAYGFGYPPVIAEAQEKAEK